MIVSATNGFEVEFDEARMDFLRNPSRYRDRFTNQKQEREGAAEQKLVEGVNLILDGYFECS